MAEDIKPPKQVLLVNMPSLSNASGVEKLSQKLTIGLKKINNFNFIPQMSLYRKIVTGKRSSTSKTNG